MTRIATLTALAAAAALTAGQASAVEIAVNGDFETGDFTGWESFLSPDASIVSDSPFAGTFNAKIDNQTPGSGAVMKNANLGIGVAQPDTEVTVSFWARGDAGAGGVHFAELFSELDGGGTSKSEILGGGAPLFPNSPTEWQQYQFTTTLGPDVSGGVTLQFNAATGANEGSFSTLEVDNVSIDVVPEPSSLALLGLGGLAALRRRRR